MRALILIVAAGSAIAGCNKDQPAQNTANIDTGATADGIASNDTTAIDAATGEDANMAADVDYTIEEESNSANADESRLTANKGEGVDN